MTTRKFFHPKDLLFFGTLAFAAGALALALALSPRGAAALVEVEGEVVLTRELSSLSAPEEVTVTGANGMELTCVFSQEGAVITASSCPDQTCVRTGTLTRAGEAAICLPARTVLRLTGSGWGDAQAY